MEQYKVATGAALRALAGGVLIALATACSVGPTYQRPQVDVPAAFKEAAPAGIWKPAQPSDAAPRGQWWTIFGNATLNKLEEEALASNQD